MLLVISRTQSWQQHSKHHHTQQARFLGGAEQSQARFHAKNRVDVFCADGYIGRVTDKAGWPAAKAWLWTLLTSARGRLMSTVHEAKTGVCRKYNSSSTFKALSRHITFPHDTTTSANNNTAKVHQHGQERNMFTCYRSSSRRMKRVERVLNVGASLVRAQDSRFFF